MKWVICPRCFNSSIELKSGNTIIPIQFSSDDEPQKPSSSKTKSETKSIKEEKIKLHNSNNKLFQCSACGASFKHKKK